MFTCFRHAVGTKMILRFVMVLVLFFNLQKETWTWQCRKDRMVLTGPRGTITDGNGTSNNDKDYSNSSRCEWLIDGGNRSIVLKFKDMDTECSYDFLFIYDGHSHSSPLLASVSGDTLPKTIIAHSGYMLLYFSTDRNYQRKGFEAEFEVQDCPLNCHGNGECQDGECICKPSYWGPYCKYEACEACGVHGECLPGPYDGQHMCHCNPDYTGKECTLPLKGEGGKYYWFTLSDPVTQFPARESHSMVYNKADLCLYVFGGFDLNHYFNDLLRFCLNKNYWQTISQKEPWPSPRSKHRMVSLDEGFYVFGGMSYNESFSNELWFFNYTSMEWSLRGQNTSDVPPPLFGHTMTLVDGRWLYVIGGKLSDGQYSSKIWRYDVTDACDCWEEVILSGGRKELRMLVGHSAVFHPESRSILVFGGYQSNQPRFSLISSRLGMFHVDRHYWTDVKYGGQSEISPRAFHSAVIMGNYMVVVGGNIHKHEEVETCYDTKLHLFHLGCHHWVDHRLLRTNAIAMENGRFGHAVVEVFGNILIVAGGYSGYVLGDLIAHKLPAVIAPPQGEEESDYCEEEYSESGSCLEDLECIYCPKRIDTGSKSCIHKHRKMMCHNPQEIPDSCLGLCRALDSCHSCLIFGQGHVATATSPLLRVYQDQCEWQNKKEICRKRHVNSSRTNTASSGWWTESAGTWTRVEQCSWYDIPAGVRQVTWHSPQNKKHPDKISIIKKWQTDVIGTGGPQRPDVVSDFKGFIHPLNALLPVGETRYRVRISYAGLAFRAYISNDSSAENLEEVAATNRSFQTNDWLELRLPSGASIFPHAERGYKYLYHIEARGKNGSLSLEWSGNSSNINIFHTFEMEFLEQYHSGDCSQYENCMACMSDASCGWCPASHTCDIKGDHPSSCKGDNATHFLITAPQNCLRCEQHMDCFTCTQDQNCEWHDESALCARRSSETGRLWHQANCSTPCHKKTNCTSCISQDKLCFWCENTQTCLPFAHYISRFINGQCREWVDNDSKDLGCKNCPSHRKCSECIHSHGCGWCGNEENALIGFCTSGEFKGPEVDSNCSAILYHQNITDTMLPAKWSYDVCPDVDMCALGLHNCHDNATCIHRPYQPFECRCNRGFEGSGQFCEPRCYFDCIHGTCSQKPDYQCKCYLGYTGDDCNTSCDCNNHSTCKTGVGICDFCQHNTTGDNCELCKEGFYGNPSHSLGCMPCECHGHGVVGMGTCNATGHCFCQDNTVGDQCQECQDGYYGDPRNGGQCFKACDNPFVLNTTKGRLGSYRGSGVDSWHAYCVWIISPFSGNIQPKANSKFDDPTINVTIMDLNTKCGWDYVYVYDGIPDFLDGSPHSHGKLLGAFCGTQTGQSVLAKSGIVTVYYETDSAAHLNALSLSPQHRLFMGLHHMLNNMGFNASYHVNDCPSFCSPNQVCDQDACVCEVGHEGPNCDIYVCPSPCTYLQDHDSCVCQSNFEGGANYSVEVYPWFFPAVPRLTGVGFGEKNRFGHTLVTCGDGILYMFGGFSLEEGLLNDLWSYNTSAQQNPWKQMTYHLLPPNGRYYHAAACVPIKKQLFVFGGFVKQKNRYVATRELWRFSIGPFKWTKIDIPDWVPPLAGHTMTLVGDVTLLIVGGFSSENYFSDKLFMIDVNANGNEAWKSFSRQEMGGTVPLGLYGHTSVYQEPTNTVYIYGGMVYETDRFMVTDTLYVLSLDGDRMEWHTLQAEPGSQKTARIFHTAVDMEDFMVVLGGHDDQAKSAKSLLVYRYLCNFWHQFQFKDVEFSIPISNVLSPRAVRSNNSIYLMGGFDNLDHSEIVKLTLPMDTCSLLSNISSCLGAVGCSACTSIIAEGNRTQQREHCFSNSGDIPEVCSSQEHGHRFQSGKQCSLQWYLERECYQYKNCSSCLAVYPRFRHSHLTCKWCTGCQGRCVSANVDCLSTRDMTEACVSEVYSRADQCSEAECAAAVCEKCASDRCVWSPTLKRRNPDSSTMLYTPNKQASWSCFHKSSLTDDDGMRTCPSRCHTHTDCHSCLQSNGGEGGSKKCIWSDLLQECMPPAYRPLHCSGGECGIIIQDAPTKCPSNCSTHQRCSECLQAPGCGWCALGGLNGIGICMRGGVNRPIGGQCDRQGVQPADGLLRAEMEEYMKSATGEPKWAFTECPMENECMNDHHDCDMQRQDCKDLTHSYKCECKKGYVWKDSKNMCEPVCHQGCENGMCTQPDVCDCQFGWVGKDCNTECKCNGYSNCISETQLHNCTHCINNTQGPDCGFCKVKFVGDPREKKPCVSCFEYCYNHTSNCVSSLTNRTTGIYGNPSMDSAVRELIHWHSFIHDQNGPKPDNAICLHCTNYTTGKRCEKCKEGYFRLETGDEFQPCMKCQCNGHSDKCSPSGGKNCLCSNNTDSPCESQKSDKSGLDECWKEQCSACKEYFMGNPARGHHCYRTMKVDINYCLDPYTQNKCDQNPGPLLQGRTVFFGVMPRFLNVDIRLTIDVFEGGVDIFFSNCDQTFVVDVNETGHHLIYLDKTLSVPHVHHSLRDVPLNFEPYFSSKVSSRLKKMLYNSSSQEDVEFIDMRADQNHMYHRVEQTNTILRIYNVQSQLVITLPHHLGLKETRFFLVAHGSGSSVSSKTYGNLYFRQDQTHIDLFVFFSVFFSSFFLFLANCVLLWKLKQAIDTRRNRLERAKEMTLMASRPFARVLLHIDADARPIVSTPIPHRKPRFSTSRNPSVQASLPPVESLNTSFQPLLKPEAPFAVAAIATEPTETGQASVRTVMFQLPGGFAAPTKLCLGSALTTNYKASNVNTKIVTRRRPSSTVC